LGAPSVSSGFSLRNHWFPREKPSVPSIETISFCHKDNLFLLQVVASQLENSLGQAQQAVAVVTFLRKSMCLGTGTVLKTKVFGLKVRHFNNSCLLIAFTRSIHALFSM
jgi:hypothetical protein